MSRLSRKLSRKQKRIINETATIALGLVIEHLDLQDALKGASDGQRWDDVDQLVDDREAWQAACEGVRTVIEELRGAQ